LCLIHECAANCYEFLIVPQFEYALLEFALKGHSFRRATPMTNK
jgi:hypothetical protein